MLGSYALAAWATLGMTALMSGALAGTVRTKEDEQMLGIVLTLFVFFPALIGLALGLSSRDARLVNPASILITIIWNAMLVASFLLLSIYGLTK